MKKARKPLALMLAIAMVLGMVPAMVFAGDDGVTRLAGANRWETSAEVALAAFPDGADTVIIARGDNAGGYADGLAASYLSGVLNAPILLTGLNSLPTAVADAIEELGAEEAIILGGVGAVSAAVEAALEALVDSVERIAGSNRYETAALIAQYDEDFDGYTAFVVGGFAPPDSMVAGPLANVNGIPVLLVGNSVPAATADAIDALGIKNIVVIGGTAVVSAAVYNELAGMVDDIDRIAGANRYLTSLEFAKEHAPNAESFAIVGGFNLADAVGAAVFGLPILYVENAAVMAYLEGVVGAGSEFFIFGGPAAVSASVEAALKAMLAPEVVDAGLALSLSDDEIIADGVNKVTVTATVMYNGVEAEGSGRVEFSSILPSLSKEDVIIEDGAASVFYTPDPVTVGQNVKITAQIIDHDIAALVGESTEIYLKINPVSDPGVVTKLVVQTVKATQADRLTMYLNTDDWAIKDFDCEEFEVNNRRIDEFIPVFGFRAVPGNPFAVEVLLDVNPVGDTVTGKYGEQVRKPMSDNSGHSLAIYDDTLFDITLSTANFDLVDAKHPTVLEAWAVDQRTIMVRFSEAVYTIDDGLHRWANSAANPSNYLIDGVRVDGLDAIVTVGDLTYVAPGVTCEVTDQRNLVKIHIPKLDYDYDLGIGLPEKLPDGLHALQVENVGDWAVYTDDRNTMTTQNYDFTVAGDFTNPVASMVQMSPEQFMVTFDKPLSAVHTGPTFQILNATAATGSGAHPKTLNEGTDGLGDITVGDAVHDVLKVTPLPGNRYLIELTVDWTWIYDSENTNVNYWSSAVNPYTLVITEFGDYLCNYVAEQKIPFSIPRDVTSPEFLGVYEIAGESYTTDPIFNLAQPVWRVDVNEPVQVWNATGVTDPLTPSQFQVYSGGLPELVIEFSKGNTHIDGVVWGIDTADMWFFIFPIDGLEPGEWTVTLKGLSDDIGNTALTKQFTVTVKPHADVKPLITWADAHYGEWFTGTAEAEDYDWIHVKFNVPMKATGAQSVLRVANWRVDGYQLPIGTSITRGICSLDDDFLDGITIRLPLGWLEDNSIHSDGDIVLDYYDLEAADGQVIPSGRIIMNGYDTTPDGDVDEIWFARPLVIIPDHCWNMPIP